MKRFFPYIILIAVNVLILVYLLFYGIPQNINRIITLVFILIFILVIFFSILSYFGPTLAKSFKWFASFLKVYNKIATVLSLILLAHIVFAIVYYSIYLNDPSKFRFDDQVHEQKVTEVKNNMNESISKINTEKEQLEQRLRNLDYILESLDKYKSHSDIDSIWKHNKMLDTDSIYFLFRDRDVPPGSDPAFDVEAFNANGVLSYTYGFKLKQDDQMLNRKNYYLESIELAREELLSDFAQKDKKALNLKENKNVWTFLDFLYFSMKNLTGEAQPNSSLLRMISMLQGIVNFFIYIIIPGYIFSKKT